jgi:hypothetical protein
MHTGCFILTETHVRQATEVVTPKVSTIRSLYSTICSFGMK